MCWMTRCPRRGVGSVRRMEKSLEDQVREIQKLISDAEATLAQAKWALETLALRIAQDDGSLGA
jgi:hypothetical protein